MARLVSQTPGGFGYVELICAWQKTISCGSVQNSSGTLVMAVDVLKWTLTDGQQYTTDLGYAPLPKAVVDQELKAVTRITIN